MKHFLTFSIIAMLSTSVNANGYISMQPNKTVAQRNFAGPSLLTLWNQGDKIAQAQKYINYQQQHYAPTTYNVILSASGDNLYTIANEQIIFKTQSCSVFPNSEPAVIVHDMSNKYNNRIIFQNGTQCNISMIYVASFK